MLHYPTSRTWLAATLVLCALTVCGCSNTTRRTIRYPYPVVQGHILQKGGKLVEREGQQWSELEIQEQSPERTVINRTWIRAAPAGANKTTIEVESVKDPALTYWQTGRERKRFNQFMKELP